LTVKAWRLLESQRSTLQLPNLKIVPALACSSIICIRTCRSKTEIYHFDHPSKFIDQEIRPHIAKMGETDFHSSVIAAFSLVRDAHTLYGRPTPYRHAVAFQCLPAGSSIRAQCA
jgi:hypothetical protein